MDRRGVSIVTPDQRDTAARIALARTRAGLQTLTAEEHEACHLTRPATDAPMRCRDLPPLSAGEPTMFDLYTGSLIARD